MIKIYQLITSVQLGGAEIVAFDLDEYCGNDSRQLLEIAIMELLSTKNQYTLAKKGELARVVTRIKDTKRVTLLFALYYIWKEKPDVIHSNTDLPDFVPSVVLRIFLFFHLQFPQIIQTIPNTKRWCNHPKLGKNTESSYFDEHVVGVLNFALKAYEQLRIKNKLPISQNLREMLKGMAYNYVSDEFSHQNMINTYSELYKESHA